MGLVNKTMIIAKVIPFDECFSDIQNISSDIATDIASDSACILLLKSIFALLRGRQFLLMF